MYFEEEGSILATELQNRAGGVPADIAHVKTAAAGVATVLTVAPALNQRVVLKDLLFSYSAPPTGGNLSITRTGAPAVVYLDLDITQGGPGPLMFQTEPMVFAPNESITITLAGGGAAIVGKLLARTWSE